ncbi:redoxin family protein [Caviibacterium pharyngocola]|uniref:Thioredoxin domain-containing protein n=1 Tax=Caviibacterium pharyngocola TaxID=28159 RepID=A0A2M8RYX3_9PAST|nr:redoxin family protein [Caviibacterium pharyngocola]PJG84081.1 hypothetical protein CVP04_01115 [Caviibacterium pharyngocola]
MKKLFISIILLFSMTSFAKENINLSGIQLKDLNNDTVTLDQYHGKKVYLKAWASWCPICLAGLDEIEQLSIDKNKKFEVVTIVSPGHKGEKMTEQFIEWYNGLEYKNITVLLDEQGEIIKTAGIRGYPSSLILDENLDVIKTIPGHLGVEQINSYIK